MYFEGWRKYFDFLGVATRSEYWSFVLINTVIGVALLLWTASTGLDILVWALSGFSLEDASIPLIAYVVFLLLIFIPTLAVTFRRVRDATGTGAWVLIVLLPFVGSLVLFIMCLMPSKRDPGVANSR